MFLIFFKKWIKNKSLWKRNRKKATDNYVEQSTLLEFIKLNLKNKTKL